VRLLDLTLTTEDEQWDPAARLARRVEVELERLKLDPYNHTYVFRLRVDRVDDPPPASEEN
jgi:hypothetical protein